MIAPGQAAGTLVNEQRLLDTFLELVHINSPSFDEREIGLFLSHRLEDAGCSVAFQEYPGSFNLIGRLKGTDALQPTLLLSAHMDTIEPTAGIKVSEDEVMIRTVGDTVLGADDKSAIAQILEALQVVRENSLSHGDLEIVFSSAEEKGLFGAKNLDPGMISSRHAIVLDSSGSPGKIIVGAPSHITYEMKISGRSSHAGIEPEKGLSAIRVAAEIIMAVPDGRIDQETTANIGIIAGGTATNVVSKEVLLHGEIRSHNRETLTGVKDGIFDNARKIAAARSAAVEISENEEYSAFHLSEDAPFLDRIRSAFGRCGIEAVLALTGGGSDANIYNHRGILAVNISNGMQKVHSTDEFILKKDLVDGCRVLLECIVPPREKSAQ